MIPREDLPADAAEWTSVEVQLDRLEEDSPESSPVPTDRVFEYVQMESADGDAADVARLTFVRTARLGDADGWIWRYEEVSGEALFVTVVERAETITTGLAEPNGLSPEQFLLAEYYNDVYWS